MDYELYMRYFRIFPKMLRYTTVLPNRRNITSSSRLWDFYWLIHDHYIWILAAEEYEES